MNDVTRREMNEAVMRAQFEAWSRSDEGLNLCYVDNRYTNTQTRSAWNAYQVALRSPAVAGLVEALKKAQRLLRQNHEAIRNTLDAQDRKEATQTMADIRAALAPFTGATTLRQAGRVDEAMVERAWDVLMKEEGEPRVAVSSVRAALEAALSAQPATQRQGEDRDGDFDVGMTKLTETRCCGQPISRHEDGQSVQWKCDKCGGSYSLREKPAPERQGEASEMPYWAWAKLRPAGPVGVPEVFLNLYEVARKVPKFTGLSGPQHCTDAEFNSAVQACFDYFAAAPSALAIGTLCSVCYEPQFDTPSGVSCPNGHGGAAPSAPQEVE